MKTLGLILMTLAVHVHSHCGVLQPDDHAFIRSEITSQLENISSPNQCSQLETVLATQAAMIASQAEIIRALADVNQPPMQRCCGECASTDKPSTTTDIPATTSSDIPATTSSDIPVTTSSDIPATTDTDCFVDCLDYRTRGSDNTSGIITTLGPDGECSQESYCDMATDDGGWTVFQKHQSDAVNFTRGWDDYKNGFGDLSDSFWWGNEKLTQALNDGRQYELRIDLFDWEGEHRYAKYSQLDVADESDNYRVSFSGYTGNTGADSFGWGQNGRQFSTIDRDNDVLSSVNCAALYGGGGFWYYNCGLFSPNGRYYCGVSIL